MLSSPLDTQLFHRRPGTPAPQLHFQRLHERQHYLRAYQFLPPLTCVATCSACSWCLAGSNHNRAASRCVFLYSSRPQCTAPLEPEVAAPDPMLIVPDIPALVVPVVKARVPLMPEGHLR